jgi:hypothetical protein
VWLCEVLCAGLGFRLNVRGVGDLMMDVCGMDGIVGF